MAQCPIPTVKQKVLITAQIQSYANVTGNNTIQNKTTTDVPSAKMLSKFLDKFKYVINSFITMLANIISKTN